MYALADNSHEIFKSTVYYYHTTNDVSKAVKFRTKAEAEFVLQDLKSRGKNLLFQVVEIQ